MRRGRLYGQGRNQRVHVIQSTGVLSTACKEGDLGNWGRPGEGGGRASNIGRKGITGKSKVFRAQVVTYADDFVILSSGHAAESMDWTRRVMTILGLTLNEAKTNIKAARKESFNFRGYTFGRNRSN